jgi:hypothetical protein
MKSFMSGSSEIRRILHEPRQAKALEYLGRGPEVRWGMI